MQDATKGNTQTSSGAGAYSGPRVQVKGRREYDRLLDLVIDWVVRDKSQEELLTLFIDELAKLTSAVAVVVLETSGPASDIPVDQPYIRGYDQRGIHSHRWRQFCETHSKEIPQASLLYSVLLEDERVDVWHSKYFPGRFEELRPLFDVRIGGWLAGLKLPPATARSTPRAIFLWYSSGSRLDQVPQGSEQDWRLLTHFRKCYEMARYHLRQTARTIIMQRQELIRSLSPAILSHEVFKRAEFTLPNIRIIQDILVHLGEARVVRESEAIASDVREATDILGEIVYPSLVRLRQICESVMNLRRRIASGTVDPIREVDSACDLLYHFAARNGVLLNRPDRAVTIAAIESDPTLLMHVVTNLLSNGIEALSIAQQNGWPDKRKIPTVWCELRWDEVTEANQLPLVVDIFDNGPGIRDNIVDRIFEPGITTKPAGHGLGLSVCRMIAGYLGGTIELRNRSNPTCFRLRLPRVATRIEDLEAELTNESES